MPIAAALGALVLTAGCSSSGTASAPHRRDGGDQPGRCVSGDLDASLAPRPGGGTAGSHYSRIQFTNTSGDRCSLNGFGVVSYVGRGGARVGRPAILMDQPRQEVILQPGDRADQLLREGEAGSYPRHRCRPAPVTAVRVRPPGSKAALVLSDATTGCADKHIILLAVGPYHKLS